MALAMAGLISAVTTMHFAIHGAEVKVPDLQGSPSRKRAPDGQYGIEPGHRQQVLQRRCAGGPGAGTISFAGRHRQARMAHARDREPGAAAGGDPKVVGQQERVAAIEVRRLGLDLEETAQMPYSGVRRAR
jgi:hypothetical protein